MMQDDYEAEGTKQRGKQATRKPYRKTARGSAVILIRNLVGGLGRSLRGWCTNHVDSESIYVTPPAIAHLIGANTADFLQPVSSACGNTCVHIKLVV
jgi:hypothetical protein